MNRQALSRVFSRGSSRALVCAISLALCAGLANAQAVIYPAKGQPAQQQDKDKYECYSWARGQTGFDPAQAQQPQPTQVASGQANPNKSSAGGMVKGALGGAAVGELTHHDAGRGAAIGVVGSTVMQRAQAKQQQAAQHQQAQQQAQQQQAARSQQRATYDRAFGACMEARGYVVK